MLGVCIGVPTVTEVLELAGPMFVTNTSADWLPVVTLPPLFPPEFVDALELLCMLPDCDEGYGISGTTVGGVCTTMGSGVRPRSLESRTSAEATMLDARSPSRTAAVMMSTGFSVVV